MGEDQRKQEGVHGTGKMAPGSVARARGQQAAMRALAGSTGLG